MSFLPLLILIFLSISTISCLIYYFSEQKYFHYLSLFCDFFVISLCVFYLLMTFSISSFGQIYPYLVVIFSILAVYFVRIKYFINYLNSFVLPIILLFYIIFLSNESDILLKRYNLLDNIHIFFSVLYFIFLCLSFSLSLIFILKNTLLKEHKLDKRLPSLIKTQNLATFLFFISFAILFVNIVFSFLSLSYKGLFSIKIFFAIIIFISQFTLVIFYKFRLISPKNFIKSISYFFFFVFIFYSLIV